MSQDVGSDLSIYDLHKAFTHTHLSARLPDFEVIVVVIEIQITLESKLRTLKALFILFIVLQLRITNAPK